MGQFESRPPDRGRSKNVIDINKYDKINGEKGGERKKKVGCVIYVDEIKDMLGEIYADQPSARRGIRSYFLAVTVYAKLRRSLHISKRRFYGKKYYEYINCSPHEDLVENFEDLKTIHNEIQLALKNNARMKQRFRFPVVFSAIGHTLEQMKSLVEEKIFDLQFSLDPEYPAAIEKIVSGIENSHLDESRVERIGSIL